MIPFAICTGSPSPSSSYRTSYKYSPFGTVLRSILRSWKRAGFPNTRTSVKVSSIALYLAIRSVSFMLFLTHGPIPDSILLHLLCKLADISALSVYFHLFLAVVTAKRTGAVPVPILQTQKRTVRKRKKRVPPAIRKADQFSTAHISPPPKNVMIFPAFTAFWISLIIPISATVIPGSDNISSIVIFKTAFSLSNPASISFARERTALWLICANFHTSNPFLLFL